MAAAPFLTDLPVERPTRKGSRFDEPVIEPFLAKHSQWYRRHSKVQRESNAATEAESARRSSSVGTGATEPAAASEPEQGVKAAEPVATEEQKPRRSSLVKALRWAFWYNGNE